MTGVQTCALPICFPVTIGAEEREHQRQLEYMGLQAQYNKEQAKYSTELSKEMWDYTNYENQKKHLEAAGLNPALLYGSSGGGGGSAAGGGTAAGVGLPASTGVGKRRSRRSKHSRRTRKRTRKPRNKCRRNGTASKGFRAPK